MGSKLATNYVRRSLGVVIASIPILLLTALLALSDHRVPRSPTMLALVPVLIALFIACLNAYLSFFRGWIHRARGRSAYRHVSSLPLIGTLLATIGGVIGSGSLVCAAIALVSYAIDPGGVLWFVVFTWRDESFWDA